MTPRTRKLLERALVTLIVAVVAVFSFSSFWIAGFVGVMTVLVVLFDMVVTSTTPDRAPLSADPTPTSLTVDLTKRP